MPQAAAPLVAESLIAESFVMAAPEMFAASSTFVPAAGELAALGAMEGMGAAGLGGLSALGAEFGTEALFGGLGETVMPTLGEGVVQGVTQGLGGAGQAGINEALVGTQQAQATNTLDQLINQFQNAPEMVEGIKSAYPAVEEVAGYGLKNSMMTPERVAQMDAELTKMGFQDGTAQVAQHPLGSSAERQALFGNTEGAYGLEGYDNRFMPLQQPTGLQAGFETALKYVKENPFSAASMGYSAMKLLGGNKKQEKPEEYNGILTKYKMSPNFQGRQANPEDFQYTPKVYAEGGVASFKSGGRSDIGGKLAMDYYESMQRQQGSAPSAARGPLAGGIGHDTGIYYDQDPETRYLDPLTAAQIRQAKINKRSNVQVPNMKRPRGLGQINLSPPGTKAEEGGASVDAAQGGIMHARRYADGGITGNGNLNLNIPLDLGGGGYGGGGGATYPFQNNSGFAGNNNAPQVTSNPSLVADQAQRMAQQASPLPGLGTPQGPLLAGGSMGQFPYAAGGPRPEGLGDSTMSDTFKGTGGFGGNPQQAISQLMGLLGGQKMAAGGMTSLGGYAAGGNPRLLKGPGDGMSDNIPATIAGKQPARLADGEFVIPADVVSHLGNGSTEAGAKVLHAMMTKVRKERTGNPKQGKQINPRKFVPT